MDKKEAIQAMLEGKKVRCANWAEGVYVKLSASGTFEYQTGTRADINSHTLYDWEIYEEPKSLTFDEAIKCNRIRLTAPEISEPWEIYVSSGIFPLIDLAERRGWHMEAVE